MAAPRGRAHPAAAALGGLLVAATFAACGAASPPRLASEPPALPSVPAPPGSTAISAAVEVAAENLAFSPVEVVGPAGVPFAFTLRNRDERIPHNVAIRAGTPVGGVAPDGPDLFVGDVFPGLATRTYEVSALPGGRYTFFCQVHPNMVGTLTLQ